jgi:phenylacetyl-CoA:acceptor oxidoreductase 26-kDa subunit
MSFGPNPWLQQHWDARAAANFMAGGCGSGLVVFAALADGPRWAYVSGAALVGLGLTAVALEIGRPLRALNVYRHPRRSWMTREAIAALLLLASALAACVGVPGAGAAAAAAAIGFVYCQGRMLRAAKGIPAWRAPAIVPLIGATALAEGGGLFLLLGGAAGSGGWPVWALFGLALAARWALWEAWRRRLQAAARALVAIDRAGRLFKAGTLLPLAAVAAALLMPRTPLLTLTLPALAGALALAAGWWFKFTLITRAAFNQGFTIAHLPVRGVRRRQVS